MLPYDTIKTVHFLILGSYESLFVCLPSVMKRKTTAVRTKNVKTDKCKNSHLPLYREITFWK
jgi:hypothetical protein